jgi:hypothetical protein
MAGIFSRSTQSFLLIFSIFLTSSCKNYYFLNPLPIDQKDLKSFPKSLQGEWLYLDSNNATSFNEGNDSILLNIVKNEIALIFINHNKVILGAWPRISKNGEKEDLNCKCEPEISVNLDTLGNPIDSTRNFILTKGALFAFEEKHKLSRQLDYIKVGDTLFVTAYDTTFFDLGSNMKLRPLNKNWHALNIRKRLLDEPGKWWDLKLLEQINKDSLNIYEANSPSNFNHQMIELKDSSENDYAYFDSKWDTPTLLGLIKEGHFGRILTLKRLKSANKKSVSYSHK